MRLQRSLFGKGPSNKGVRVDELDGLPGFCDVTGLHGGTLALRAQGR